MATQNKLNVAAQIAACPEELERVIFSYIYDRIPYELFIIGSMVIIIKGLLKGSFEERSESKSELDRDQMMTTIGKIGGAWPSFLLQDSTLLLAVYGHHQRVINIADPDFFPILDQLLQHLQVAENFRDFGGGEPISVPS